VRTNLDNGVTSKDLDLVDLAAPPSPIFFSSALSPSTWIQKILPVVDDYSLHCSTTPNLPNANLINCGSVGPQYRALQIVSFFARHRYLGLYQPPHSELGAILEPSFPDDAFLPAQFDPFPLLHYGKILSLCPCFYARFSSFSDCAISTSRTGIPLFFCCWSGRFIGVVHLNLKVRFTGIAWPPIFNLTYTRRSSFQPNAFQEKVHVEVIDRFTVCFFSLSTSVRRSDFSFNSLRLDAVSSKTIISTSLSTLRFRTAYFYTSGSEDLLNIIGQHPLGNACQKKRTHSIRGSAFKQPCIYALTSLSLSHSFIQRRRLTPQNQDQPSNSPSESIFFRSRIAGRISDDGGWK